MSRRAWSRMGAARCQTSRRFVSIARAMGVCAGVALCAAAVAQGMGPMPSEASADQSEAAADQAKGPVPSNEGALVASPTQSVLESKPLGTPKTRPAPWTTAPANSPVAAQNPASLAGMVRTVLSLAGVVAIIVGLAFAFKRLSRGSGGLMNQLGAGGRAPSGVLSILGRYPVARGTTLVLLKVDRRVILLCQSAGKGLTAGCTMQTLSEFTDPEDVASILLKTRDEEEASLAHRFEAMLSREDAAATRALSPASGAQVAPMAKPAQTRAARAAAKQPDAVMRPSSVPSDPRAQIGREPERLGARTDAVARSAPKAPSNGPLLRGVVA